MSSSHPIINFFSGGRDYRGRTLTQILSWTDEELEDHHDYIQIVFPLPEKSGISFSAPVVDREVFESFREDAKLRTELRRAWVRILGFYGFELQKDEDDEIEVPNSEIYPLFNYNFLLGRQITSLSQEFTKLALSLRSQPPADYTNHSMSAGSGLRERSISLP